MKCRVCGSNIGEGCIPKNWQICQSHYFNLLSAEDWKNIYRFYKLVYLPFIHSILVGAEERKKNEQRTTNHI